MEQNTQTSELSSIEIKPTSSALTRFLPSLLMIVSGLSLIMFNMTIEPNSQVQERLIFYMGVGGLGLIIVGAATSSLSYLSGGIRTQTSAKEKSDQTDHFSEIINTFAKQLDETQQKTIEQLRNTTHTKLSLSAKDREEVTSAIKNQITDNVAEELLKSVSNKSKSVFTSIETSELRSRFIQAKSRIIEEVAALSRRGNLNLVIGGITTGLAVALLVYIVLNAAPTIKAEDRDLDALLWHYVPRLSIAIFIEIFSFFFLKLYRNSLEDIKFFQNEITNIESRIIALEAAIYSGNQSSIENVVLELSKTERNFKLHKGESTVDLEKAKLDSQGIKDFVTSITSILKRTK